jgi:azurin
MRVKSLLSRGFFIGLFLSGTISLAARPVADSVTTISIKAISGLQYDLVRFAIKPEEKVKIIFSNTDDMSHNLLITTPGSREEVVEAAIQLEEKGPSMDYIPKSSEVLWSIPVIAPGETLSLTFTAPKEPGVYPYVCTFPGHGFIMYGAIYVNKDGKMPDINEDKNIPPSRRKANSDNSKKGNKMHHEEVAKPLHPYNPTPPYLYRTYMENASPAAIAVSLPQNVSYCWDAGTCRLRYAWQGGFIDNQTLWKGKPNAVGKILGNIFYKDDVNYPIQIGSSDDAPEVEYKGYRLINRYPEFHYTVNNVDVYELIHPKDDGSGLIRTFKIPNAGQEVIFRSESKELVKYETSVGYWENGQLKLSPAEAENFSITITKKNNL